MLQLVPSHGSHGGHGGHDGHGGHVSHVGVGSGSEAPARSPKGVEITAPLRDPQKCFHPAHWRLKRVLNLDVVSPPPRPERVEGVGRCDGDGALETKRSLHSGGEDVSGGSSAAEDWVEEVEVDQGIAEDDGLGRDRHCSRVSRKE